MFKYIGLNSALQISLLAWILLTSTAQAATINVNSQFDDNIGCTLRNAVLSANGDTSVGGCTAGSGDDVINLAGISGLTITLATGPGFGEINISDGTPNSTVIEGAGVTINGAGATRLFTIDTPATLVRLVLVGGASASAGGAIVLGVGNTLEIRDSALGSNTSTGTLPGDSGGGAIALGNGTLIVKNSTFASNSATTFGGAIRAFTGANIELVNTTFSGNSAAEGGGIFTVADA